MSVTDAQINSTGYNVVKLYGMSVTPTSTTVTASLVTSAGSISRAFGATTPTDGEAGYAVGCYFINTVGGPGNAAYVNEGTSVSCSFRAFGVGGTLTHANKAAINATGTATAAQVATGYITSTSAAATAITLPSGTLLGGALGATQGTVLDLFVDNTAGANTVTMVVAANGILSAAAAANAASFGLLTIPSGVTGLACFRIMFSSPTAYVFTRTA